MSKALDDAIASWCPDDEEDFRGGWNACAEAAAKLLDEKAAGCRGYSSETVFILAAEDVRNLTAEGKR